MKEVHIEELGLEKPYDAATSSSEDADTARDRSNGSAANPDRQNGGDKSASSRQQEEGSASQSELKPLDGDTSATSADVEDEDWTAEEQQEIEKADTLKKQGNQFFKDGKYLEAIEAYKEAAVVAPSRAQAVKAVFHCNATQAHIKLEQYEDAAKEASKVLSLKPTQAIRVKALLRRAQCYEELKDYLRANSDYEVLASIDPKNNSYQASLKRLKPLVEAENERTKTEMLAKLKDLGNTVLGKFGLSVENFKAVKDPNTGQYSISMQQ